MWMLAKIQAPCIMFLSSRPLSNKVSLDRPPLAVHILLLIVLALAVSPRLCRLVMTYT